MLWSVSWSVSSGHHVMASLQNVDTHSGSPTLGCVKRPAMDDPEDFVPSMGASALAGALQLYRQVFPRDSAQ